MLSLSSIFSDTLSKKDSSSIIFEDSDSSLFGSKSLNDMESNLFLMSDINDVITS